MKVLIALLAIVTVSLTPAHAGDDHNHEAAVEPAPHGGVLRDAPPFKVELVLNGDTAKVYFYDKALKPAKLEKDTLVGKLRFPKEKKDREVTFTKKTDSYEGTLTGISKTHRYDLHINVESGGKKVVVDFGVDNIH